jgi:uncharacterized protein YdeI (YjbR/CyaY-like superfamily)
MNPIFFASPSEFRKWLEKNHDKAQELVVGFYKVGSGKANMTWSESIDQALCFGWIDGVRTSIDSNSYKIRFTPRKPSSIWSAVNIRKIKELTKQGLVHEAGLAAFKRRTAAKSKVYSFEKKEVGFSPVFEKLFKANKKAWAYFQSLAPGYRKTSIHWVMSAKQEGTQKKRLDILIADSERGTNQWKDNKYKK